MGGFSRNIRMKILAAIRNAKVRFLSHLDIYYSSKLAGQVAEGRYGIENMDAKYLAEDLIENESKLFD